MASLEDLLGPRFEEMTDEQLETCIMKGRLAREEESTGYKTKKKAAAAKKKGDMPDFDLDDLGLEDIEL